MSKKIAYGFPVLQYQNGDVYGLVYAEDGEYLGHWHSSSIAWLKEDLSNHTKEYTYIFTEIIPDFLQSQAREHLR